jgi:hypothetical protein
VTATAVLVRSNARPNPRAADLLRSARDRERSAPPSEVIRAYEQAITSAEQSGTHNVLAEALRRLAVVHHHDGKWTLARRLVERSLAVACAAAGEVLARRSIPSVG